MSHYSKKINYAIDLENVCLEYKAMMVLEIIKHYLGENVVKDNILLLSYGNETGETDDAPFFEFKPIEEICLDFNNSDYHIEFFGHEVLDLRDTSVSRVDDFCGYLEDYYIDKTQITKK